MAKDKKLWIDMCAGSELKDTQGETLSVEGADIADLEMGKGRLNDNHGKGFFNSVGRVTEAKKIMKAEDCENDRQKYYWEKIKAPYIYAKGYLYSDEDHPNAKAAAAIMRNIHREDAPLAMKASVEGGVIARGIKDNTRLARTKIHSVALTFTPANNATLVEPLNLNKSDTNWEADQQLIKSVMHLAETNVPSFRHIERHASANTIYDNIHKIQELAKTVGVDIEIRDVSSPEEIMKNAVMHKISDNVNKINSMVKAIKKPAEAVSAEPKQDWSESIAERKQAKRDKFEQGMKQMRDQNAASTPMAPASKPEAKPEKQPIISGEQHKKNILFGRHAAKAAKDPNHLFEVYKQLRDTHGKEKAGVAIRHIKEKMKKSIKESMIKALTAGYGGAGAPTNLTGGGAIQSESLEDGRPKNLTVKNETSDGISYISCDQCGHEQAYMKHQVKCRDCNKNFSLAKLEDFMKSLKKKIEKAEPNYNKLPSEYNKVNTVHYELTHGDTDRSFTGKDAIAAQDHAVENAPHVVDMLNENGQKEPHVLMFRGVNSYDSQEKGRNTVYDDKTHVVSNGDSVHTVDPEYAADFANLGTARRRDPHSKNNIFGFWVPKSKIHSTSAYLAQKMVDAGHDDPTGEGGDSHIAIHPGRYKKVSQDELKQLMESDKYSPIHPMKEYLSDINRSNTHTKD